MSGKVREGNRRGFLARVTKNKRQKKRGKNFMESFGKRSYCEYKKIIFKSRNSLKLNDLKAKQKSDPKCLIV